MNHKHLEGFIGSVCGTIGYGYMQVNLHINPEVLKFALSMISASCAAAVGFFTQLFIKWILKKVKQNKDGKQQRSNESN